MPQVKIVVDGTPVHEIALPASGHRSSNLKEIHDDEIEDYQSAGVEIFWWPVEPGRVFAPCVREQDVLK